MQIRIYSYKTVRTHSHQAVILHEHMRTQLSFCAQRSAVAESISHKALNPATSRRVTGGQGLLFAAQGSNGIHGFADQRRPFV